MSFDLLNGLMFDAFCGSLGCGGSIGLLLVGIVIMLIFIVTAYKLRLGLDSVLIIMSFLIIVLAQNGYLISGLEFIPYAVVGIIWGVVIYRLFVS